MATCWGVPAKCMASWRGELIIKGWRSSPEVTSHDVISWWGQKWLYFMKGLQSHLGQMDKSKSENSVLFPCEWGSWQSARSSLSMLHLHLALLCIDSLINPFVEWLAMTRCSKDASRGLWGSFAKTSDITITPGSQLKPHNSVENSILIHLCFSSENLFALCGLVDAFGQGDNSRREPEFGVCNSITTFHF